MFQGGFDQISSINISFDLPDIQELISGLKELFSCEEETKCTDIKQASMLTGNAPTAGGDFLSMVGGIMSGQAGSFPEPIGSVMGALDDFRSSIDNAKSGILGVADSVTGAIDDVTGAASGIIDSVTGVADFIKGGAGISEVLGACDMGPQGCGTPTLKAFGKEFSAPPLMNAIVSPTGKLLGADILDAGADLLGMNIAVQDKCGKGSGGYGRPILDENGSLTDIVFSNTGGVIYHAPMVLLEEMELSLEKHQILFVFCLRVT